MVKYLLVEDERFAYEELKRMMQRLRPSWQLAGWAESVEQAVLLLRQGSLDLMNVDIRLICRICLELSLIHISETTRLRRISYAIFCLKKKSTNAIIQILYQHSTHAPKNYVTFLNAYGI